MPGRTSILVPLDRSTAAEAVLPYAEAVARSMGLGLLLLTVVPESAEGLLGSPQQRAHEGAVPYLADLAAALQNGGGQVTSRVVRGEPVPALVAASEDDAVAMVAMATRGRGSVSRWILGSVADKVMRMSRKPTLLIRPPQIPSGTGVMGFGRLLVPLDGSALAETALQPAIELSETTGAQLFLLQVVPSEIMTYGREDTGLDLDAFAREMIAAAEAYLADVQTRLPAGVSAETVVSCGPIAPMIEDAVGREGIDLVVLTTHARSGMPRFVLGSTADRLIRAGVPTLLVHPESASAAEIPFQDVRLPII